MKVKELIEKLQSLDSDLHVCIYDWRMNVHYADGDPNGNGIQLLSEVSVENNDVEEEDEDWRPKQWVALTYDNQDYTETGEKED